METVNIELKNIQKAYASPVLTDINLKIDSGSCIAITGKSGAGKSTLMNILGLIEGFDGGSYFFNGRKLRPGRDYAGLRLEKIGFIFQSYNLIPNLTCRENILMPVMYKKGGGENMERLCATLEIEGILGSPAGVLSGGEQQRAAIARALILNPGIIIADEPTGNLDAQNRDAVLDILLEQHRSEGRALVIITHDPYVASKAENVFELKGGALHEK